MKLAHLILAHSQPQQLNRLITALQHSDAAFYIHIDSKTDSAPFLETIRGENIFFVRKRENVRWGAYSMVQATLNGFEEVVASGIDYEYVNLLSGQDYPLQNPKKIHHYLSAEYPKQFMEFLSVETEWQEAIPRLTKYHFVHFNFPGKFMLEAWANRWLPVRKMPNSWVAVGRSQWFTITLDAVKFLVKTLQENGHIVRFFKLTWGVDELIFQTILYNSPFRASMVNDNLRYIDWSEGKSSPKTLRLEDESALLNSGKLFARKFNAEIDQTILDNLDTKRLTS